MNVGRCPFRWPRTKFASRQSLGEFQRRRLVALQRAKTGGILIVATCSSVAIDGYFAKTLVGTRSIAAQAIVIVRAHRLPKKLEIGRSHGSIK